MRIPERTLKFKLTKATLTINGKQEYFLDSDNWVGIVNGVDLLERVRKNVM